ncbi:hypothetical protein [Aestuariispira insulae]|uniref:hypothetical protein n=1 Tax=Aestuariispira insulae TaxID=1461337 RepID=UPI0011C01E39|nr:hypothetical protein [Aestuariispira insulae]
MTFVTGFRHEYLFAITPHDIQKVINDSEHALGDVKSKEQLAEIENYTCPFALQHIFHDYLEKNQKIPTWQDFWLWMTEDARSLWLTPLAPTLHKLFRQYGCWDRIKRAVRWRLGKFYYSAIREVDLIAHLHSNDVPVKYHLLADVLFRTDFWLDDVIISLYFKNRKYRDGQTGRKPKTFDLFEDAEPPFELREYGVDRQGFGEFWLVKDESKRELVAELSKLLVR